MNVNRLVIEAEIRHALYTSKKFNKNALSIHSECRNANGNKKKKKQMYLLRFLRFRLNPLYTINIAKHSETPIIITNNREVQNTCII